MQKELTFLGQIRENPAKPFVALVGGSKVSDKIEVLEKLLDKVDALAIGGAMAYTFMAAQGISTGNSHSQEKDKNWSSREALMAKAKAKGVNLLLPKDHVVVTAIADPASAKNTDGPAIAAGEIGVDIGPATLERLVAPMAQAKTIFWNGPMGIFEIDRYAHGTREVAKMAAGAAQRGATVVVGGGDSVAAVQATGLADKITHISTGGGAAWGFTEEQGPARRHGPESLNKEQPMYPVVLSIHVLICLMVVMIILVQSGKGAGFSGLFGGGSSDALFNAPSGSMFLRKVTTFLAVAFFTTALPLPCSARATARH